MKPAIPFACIRQHATGSFCGRSIPSEEYAFTDPGHAISQHEGGLHLRVCVDCVVAAKPFVEAGNQSRLGGGR